MPPDRSWMRHRVDPRDCSLTQEFKSGVKEFLDFAYSHPRFVSSGMIKCPCLRCDLVKPQDRKTVTLHLYRWGFRSFYTTWSAHGEILAPQTCEAETCEAPVANGEAQEVVENRYREMVMDAAGPELRMNDMREEPNSEAAKFFKLLQEADEPLWDGCLNQSRLSWVSQLMNCKSEFNMSQSCYNRITSIVRNTLPPDSLLPVDFYRSKKMLKKLILAYEKIDACPNDCMIYWKEHAQKRECMVCSHPRFKPGKKGKRKRKEVPFKVLRYLPLTPRLQRLFMSSKTAQHMSWHKVNCRSGGVLSHPSDGEAWKHLDNLYPSFSSDGRNVRLGLATDGFNPFGHSSRPYSCWPVFVTPYNLPPWMCMKESVLFLTLIIPGPKSPGKNIDVYLRPLIEELKILWDVGVTTYDVSQEQNFQMRAALLWTINDFPAYGMVSGWSTHGKMSCPYCMENSKAFFLKHGGKPTFFDCHRQFLPLNHPYRKDKDNFYIGRVEVDDPPPRLGGDTLLFRLNEFPQIPLGITNKVKKWPDYGKLHNWTKKSIFWELPYWCSNLIRHNLDVMHIEKNVFENVFNTVMDVKGKTKDDIKSRQDMKLICKRTNLNLFEQKGKLMKPKAPFALSKPQVKTICEWIKELRFPDGYASNISSCVDLDDYTLSGMKSHDCHVFMQRLIPVAFREVLPKSIWDALTELSHFFRDICSTVMHVGHMETLEKNIVETLCKLEKVFPPGFFNRFRHEETVTPEQARQIWEERAKDRCRGTWALVRKNCKNVTKSDDPSDWKGCKPKFVNVDDWNDILKSWTEPEWKLRSVVGAKNRKSVPGEEEGTCSYVRHTGGPVSFDVHEYRLEEKFGKSISEIEFYETFHKSKKGEGDWCDVRSQKFAMKYKEAIIVPDEADDANEISVSDIPFDPEAWVKATGVPMKDNIYGFGRTNIAKKIHQLANPSKRKRSTTCSSTLMDDEAFIDSQVNTRVEAILESQVDARVESRLDDLRAEMREERKLEMEEIMRMFNIQQKTMSSRE